MFLVEPDKLNIKRHLWFSVYHASLQDFKARRTSKKGKTYAVLYEFADVANALWRNFATSFKQSNVEITISHYVANPLLKSLLKCPA